jgi:hypothetical protein
MDAGAIRHSRQWLAQWLWGSVDAETFWFAKGGGRADINLAAMIIWLSVCCLCAALNAVHHAALVALVRYDRFSWRDYSNWCSTIELASTRSNRGGKFSK